MITNKQLRALLTIAPSNDARYHINSINVDRGPREGTVRLTTTDGLIIVSFIASSDCPHDVLPVTIPREAVVMAASTRCGVDLSHGEGGWTIGSVRFQPVDRDYVDWRRCIPVIKQGAVPENAPYNPELLLRLTKAARLLGAKGQVLQPFNSAPDHAGVVTLPCSGIGVIMPARSPGDTTKWAETIAATVSAALER